MEFAGEGGTRAMLPETLLTTKEVMAVMRFSRSGLAGLVRSRRIASLLVGGRLRFRRRDVEAFLKASERPARDPPTRC
jgi:excisionase family DNA binding protein